MRKITHFLAIIGFLALILARCAPLYIPPAAHVPQLKHSGDLDGTVQAGVQGIGGNLVYAFTNRFCLLGSCSYLNHQDPANGNTKRMQRYWDLGTGWFLPPSDYFSLLVAVGIGNGQSYSHYEDHYIIRNYKGDYARYFLQINTAYTWEEGSIGLATRYAHLNMRYEDLLSQRGSERRMESYLEAICYMVVGSPHIKFIGQIGASSYSGDENEIPHFPMIISVGLGFNLNLLGNGEY